ncbi:hypothetical protein [Streptacidiphilus melanogenes]|uniref:hypothetical protein n=1 Tax=Streptacidiphilus melanogenes TaxID=411235 RepID=UPI0005A7F14C|nr:hypothetical protein [Streptacidiphilus melanogenes]
MPEFDVPVSYYTFAVQDVAEVGECFPAGLVGLDAAAFVEVRPGRLDVTTAVHTHQVALIVDFLSATPTPAIEEQVEARASGTLTLPSGELAVWEMTGRTPLSFRLPQGSGTYGFDAVSRGPKAARQEELEGEGGLVDGGADPDPVLAGAVGRPGIGIFGPRARDSKSHWEPNWPPRSRSRGPIMIVHGTKP